MRHQSRRGLVRLRGPMARRPRRTRAVSTVSLVSLSRSREERHGVSPIAGTQVRNPVREATPVGRRTMSGERDRRDRRDRPRPTRPLAMWVTETVRDRRETERPPAMRRLARDMVRWPCLVALGVSLWHDSCMSQSSLGLNPRPTGLALARFLHHSQSSANAWSSKSIAKSAAMVQSEASS